MQPMSCRSTAGSDEVIRERTLDAPPADVWETLTDEALLAQWLADDVELDLREGGAARFELADGETRHARIEEVRPEERLTFSWWADADDPPQRVDFRLEPADGRRTRLIVVETRAPGAPAWSPSLSALSAMHAGLVCV